MPAPKGNKFAAKPPEALAADRLHIRSTAARKARWQAAADARGLPLTDWATAAVDRQADSDLPPDLPATRVS